VTRTCPPLIVVVSFVLGTIGACTEESPVDQTPLRDGAVADAGLPSLPVRDAATHPDAAADAALPMPSGPSPFGVPCESAADCAPGLLCLRSDSNDWLGGGPAHGYCSLDCTSDPDLCLSYDARARCQTGRQMTEGYCMKGCTLGDATGEDKCANRPDVSCALVGFLPTCLPTCGGDADCPAGRHCHQADGICVDGPRAGDRPGVACDPSAFDTNCDAYCSTLSNGEGVCSGLCTIGAEYQCNVPTGTQEVIGLPLCMSFTGDRAGDTGICVQRCQCDDDCEHPSAYCDLGVAEARDGIGVCLYDFTVDAGTRGLACAADRDADVNGTDGSR
jgi:hypothetical protein